MSWEAESAVLASGRKVIGVVLAMSEERAASRDRITTLTKKRLLLSEQSRRAQGLQSGSTVPCQGATGRRFSLHCVEVGTCLAVQFLIASAFQLRTRKRKGTLVRTHLPAFCCLQRFTCEFP